MKYLKALFFSFLVIFFANYLLPGIEITDRTKLPHLGAEIPFALILGFLNAFIYPALRGLKGRAPILQIIAISIALNFIAYGCLTLFALGIHITSPRWYLLVTLVVTIASCLANFAEMKGDVNPPNHPDVMPHEDHSSS